MDEGFLHEWPSVEDLKKGQNPNDFNLKELKLLATS